MSEIEGDDPKELGKQPRGKKSKVRDAGRKKTPKGLQQTQRGQALRQEEARSCNKRRGRWLEQRYPPHCRDERQDRKGNTLGAEKPLAAKTVLLVNWQQANTLITKLLDGQEKHWQRSNSHSF